MDGNDMKGLKLEPRCVCANDVKLWTKGKKRLCAQTMRAQALWISVEVVVGVLLVPCHAIMNVFIDVRVMQCHAIIDVVIGVRVMLCHQAIDNSGFSTSEFSISCPKFSSCCHPVAIHHHFSL